MDKRVVFAVAGSGKTTSILDRVENDSKYLIITYTDNNTQHLKSKIIQKLVKYPMEYGSIATLRFYIHFAIGHFVIMK